jgi:dienelactone hydrolase
MSFYRGMTCENVTIQGDKGTPITAYVARPAGPGPFPGVVLIHHLPGWSELYIETTRRFAHHGYLAICANLYHREGGPITTARLVSSAHALAAGTPSSTPVKSTTSTPSSSSGAAAW